MSYEYMPACCSVYTDADLARIESDITADKIKSLEKEVETLKRKLEEVPTIDAVPVVRCKDCKYWQQATPNSGNCSMGFAPTAYADDFCSFGERSEK